VSTSEPNEPPTADAARVYRELETLVRHLTDELASFRRRAFAAEAELRTRAEAPAEPAAAAAGAETTARPAVAAEAGPASADDRLAALERENADLRRRVEQAGARTRQLLERVRFLRQQHVVGG
jgi:hypothetical protein